MALGEKVQISLQNGPGFDFEDLQDCYHHLYIEVWLSEDNVYSFENQSDTELSSPQMTNLVY